MRVYILAAGLLAASAFFFQAAAAPITYDEAVDGEIENTTVLTLGEGTNTVAATTVIIPYGDFDRFDVIVEEGYELLNVSLEVKNIAVSDIGDVVDFFFMAGLFLSPSTTINTETASFIENHTFLMTSIVLSLYDGAPLPADIYRVGVSGGGVINTTTGLSVLADYVWSFDVGKAPVSEVPVPAALVFMLSGLCGLGAMRRRRRSVA